MKNKNANILVVDDSSSNLIGLQKILEKESFSVFTAISGEVALEILLKEKIDAVLLDIMMPGFSGFDVLDKMQEEPGMKYIPVIVVSARTSSTDIKNALEKGAVDYIKKPIDIIELIARVNAALRLKYRYDIINRIKEINQVTGESGWKKSLKECTAKIDELIKDKEWLECLGNNKKQQILEIKEKAESIDRQFDEFIENCLKITD